MVQKLSKNISIPNKELQLFYFNTLSNLDSSLYSSANEDKIVHLVGQFWSKIKYKKSSTSRDKKTAKENLVPILGDPALIHKNYHVWLILFGTTLRLVLFKEDQLAVSEEPFFTPKTDQQIEKELNNMDSDAHKLSRILKKADIRDFMPSTTCRWETWTI